MSPFMVLYNLPLFAVFFAVWAAHIQVVQVEMNCKALADVIEFKFIDGGSKVSAQLPSHRSPFCE